MNGRSIRAALAAIASISMSVPAHAGHSGSPVFTLVPNCGPIGPAPQQPEEPVIPNDPPLAPILRSPANGATVNFLTPAGRTFRWTFRDPNPGDTQGAYAFRRREEAPSTILSVPQAQSSDISAAQADEFEWWDASTNSWVTTEVFNPGTSEEIVFPAGSWQNHVTYHWTVANKDSFGAQGPYANEFTVIGNAPPNAPNLISPADNGGQSVFASSTYQWQFSDPDPGDSQTSWAFRRTVTATTESAPSWWRVSTSSWVSFQVYNPGSIQRYTFPDTQGNGQDTWRSGSYRWTVSTRDIFGATGPYANPRTVHYFVPEPRSVSSGGLPDDQDQVVLVAGTVEAAQVGPLPRSAPVTSAQVVSGNYEITVNGSGFSASAAIRIVFDVGGFEEAFSVTSGPTGSFSTQITPRSRPLGTYLVRAQDSAHEVIKKFYVPCPTLTLKPEVVRRGFTAVATGEGFPPGVPVLLDWSLGLGTTPVVPDASGSFETMVLVFPKDLLGRRNLLGTVPSEPEFPAPEATALIVPGPMAPADFIVRR